MRALALPALGAVLTALLSTGCGLLGGGGAGTADAEAGGEPSMEEAMLDFAACMRDNGVDVPDPEGGNMPAMPVSGPDDDEMTAALEECEELLPVDENAPTEQEAFEDSLELAECLREQGLDVPDPEPGVGMTLPEVRGDENMEAVAACTGGSIQLDGAGAESGDGS
ncbi:hypothetical protein [Nocardiopsis tropica]|uniref:Secreted protein n=1 Tax=Nocardiopsis tropica TaxID=109330 RepID=A0ABV1ZN14_9ACTN